MSREQDFLDVIFTNLSDPAPRMLFADWLEEQGDDMRAAFWRLEVEPGKLLTRIDGESGELRIRGHGYGYDDGDGDGYGYGMGYHDESGCGLHREAGDGSGNGSDYGGVFGTGGGRGAGSAGALLAAGC